MKQFFFLLLFLLSISARPSYALEIPENYSSQISAVDFYPSGAKFTFAVEPKGEDGDFTAVIPGAFRADSIRLANPESVYGNIYVASYPRTKWTPSQLESLRQQAELQSRVVNDLNAKRLALEQTLNLLKNSNPEKSKPDDLLKYIMEAQNVRLETENDLSRIKTLLSDDSEWVRCVTLYAIAHEHIADIYGRIQMFLYDPSPIVREAALYAMNYINMKISETDGRYLLNDTDAYLCRYSRSVLQPKA